MLTLLIFGAFAAIGVILYFSDTWFLNLPRRWRIPIAVLTVVGLFAGIYSIQREAYKAEPVWAVGKTEVNWSRTPIRVKASPVLRQDVAQGAISILNRRGCTLFRLVPPQDSWDVEVAIGSYGATAPGTDVLMAGSTWRVKKPNTPMRYRIELHDPGNITRQMLILAHELTHVIGLAHDKDPRYITTTGAQQYDDLSKRLPYLSAKDTSALKARYCH